MRAFAESAGRVLGVPVVVENKPGAGGTLGAEVAAKAAPDGYTFLIGAVHHTIAVSMYPKLGYDLSKDLVPVTMLSLVPNVLVINPQKLPMRSYEDFYNYVRANPGKLNFASAGNGTAHQLVVELYKTQTRTFMTHIPYRGAGPALQDLLAPQPLEAPLASSYTGPTWGQTGYSAQHVLPFLLDLFASAPREWSVAWIGGHQAMFDLFAAAWLRDGSSSLTTWKGPSPRQRWRPRSASRSRVPLNSRMSSSSTSHAGMDWTLHWTASAGRTRRCLMPSRTRSPS